MAAHESVCSESLEICMKGIGAAVTVAETHECNKHSLTKEHFLSSTHGLNTAIINKTRILI
jgi:hypothetical protein